MIVFILFFIFSIAGNSFHLDELETAWQKWRDEFNNTKTVLKRGFGDKQKLAFSENYNFVREHDSKKRSWTLELNKFSSIPWDEFRRRSDHKLGAKTTRIVNSTYQSLRGHPPGSVDWRPKLVNPVKDQRRDDCKGAGWAFSAIASLEGAIAKLTEKKELLSEQNLIDCVKDYNNCCEGCADGRIDVAFDYIKNKQDGKNDLDSAYPYTSKDEGDCSYQKSKVFQDVVLSEYIQVAQNQEDQLLSVVADQGVISIVVNAGRQWQQYKGGVVDDDEFCDSDDLNHAVAIVGYGTDSSVGKDYWLVRNSWGKDWGEEGYIRLIRGKNMCGVAEMPLYPKLDFGD